MGKTSHGKTNVKLSEAIKQICLFVCYFCSVGIIKLFPFVILSDVLSLSSIAK